MQTVIFATSGTNALHSRMTSGVQACCCSGVPCAAAGAGAKPTIQAMPRIAAPVASRDVETFFCPSVFIGEPVPCLLGLWHSPVEACGLGLGRSFGRFCVERSASLVMASLVVASLVVASFVAPSAALAEL